MFSNKQLKYISSSINNLARATREASDTESYLKRAELAQEKEFFEANQITKDRVNISLRDYENLKADLKETKESRDSYKKVVQNLLIKIPKEDQEEVFKHLQENKFNVISESLPWEFTHNVGIIFTIDDIRRD